MKELYERFEEAGSGIEAGLFAIAIAIQELAGQVRALGVGDAATTMGAIEALAVKVGEAGDSIANAIIEGGER